ncbi:MAG: NfeD family protein [Actinomycetota bacterium]
MALLIGGTLAYFFLPFPWFVVTVVVLAAFELVEARLWWWAIKRRPLAGHESLVGERAVLSAPDRVRVRGTSYPARVLEGEPGDRVVVEAVEGMTLVVRRAPEEEW